MKAVEPPCDHEPGLTRWLARRFPRAIAPVVAVDRRGRWLLTRAAHGPTLRYRSRLSDWTRAAREYGRLQRATLGSPALPRVLHRRRRDLAWLAAQIDPLVRDTRAPRRGRAVASHARADRPAPPPRAAPARALPGARAPAGSRSRSITADLWGANVVVGARGPVILDWEDAVLATSRSGRCSCCRGATASGSAGAHRSAAAARLGDAYLAGWAGREGGGTVPRGVPALARARARCTTRRSGGMTCCRISTTAWRPPRCCRSSCGGLLEANRSRLGARCAPWPARACTCPSPP